MKKFVFELTLTEEDLAGDEFWEDAIKNDGTGIADLTELLETMILESNICYNIEKPISDILKLKSYTDI